MDRQNILRNDRSLMGCLLINGKRYPIYKGINSIGRCITATVPLKSLDISKQHAIVTVIGENEHYISDFQSFNGTVLKDSKLHPLVLYKLDENSTINFGSVTAKYNMVTPATHEDYDLDSFHNTQIATQSLYDANTQTAEKEISVRNSLPNVQLENFFDDDYSFDFHEVPTQKACTDTSPIVDDVTDIHNIETQKLDLNPTIKLNERLNINDIPTQILTLESEKENSDTTLIIDETVLNNFNEVPEVIISEANETTEDSDSHSGLHVSQLYRRSAKPIPDSEESDQSISEVICSTQTPDEVIKYKQKRRFVIESDSETDVENLDENIKNDLGFDTDEGIETNIEKFGSINHSVPKTVHINSIAGIESDSDVDDFEFNAHISDQSKSDNIKSSKNSEHSINSDDIIPGTQLNEEVSNENTVKKSSKMINSVDDMDSLYLEATQMIGHDSHTDKKNVTTLSDYESICKRSLELNEQVEECNTNLAEPEVNSILEKLDVSKNDLNELEDSQSQNEDLLLVQSKPKHFVMETSKIICIDSSALEAHNLCFEETQLIDIDQQKISERLKGNKEELLKHIQPVMKTNDENCKQMKDVNEVESTFEPHCNQQKESATMKKSDDIFLEPIQPLSIVNDQKNKRAKGIQSTLSCHREQHDNTEETDDIFLESTQPLHFDNNHRSKRVIDTKEEFLQSIQTNISLHGEQLDNTGETDDIFLKPTQPLNVFSVQRSKIVESSEDVFLKSQKSQHAENTREDDDVCLNVSLTTVIAKNKNGIEDLEDIFHEPTQLIIEGNNMEEVITADEAVSKSMLVISNDITNKNCKIKDGKKKDPIVLKYSSPINVAINQNDRDKKNPSLAQKIHSLENLTNVGINTSVENKLEEIFATEKLLTSNEIESQFEVLFESQNVYYRSDISQRPKNPLLNEFENGNRKELLNTDDSGTNAETSAPLVAEEVQKNLPNSDLSITNCIEDDSKNDDKPKRLSLSLKSNLRLGSDREIRLAKIPNNFCKNDEVETTNNTEEPMNSISEKPNDTKISKSKSINEKFKKIVDKSSNACIEEVRSCTFNNDTVKLMRIGNRLRNSKTINLTDITKSPEMVSIEDDSSKSTKTRVLSTRSRTTIQNNNIDTPNLQETESPKTSKCTRTRTRLKNQNRNTEREEINVIAAASNSRKLEKEKASQAAKGKNTETKEAIINQDDLYINSCKVANEIDTSISEKSPTKFTYDQLNNPSVKTNKRKLSISTSNKELDSESQKPNTHMVKKTRRLEFNVMESKSVQLTQPNKKKRTLTDPPATSRTKQKKKDVDEVNVYTPVKSLSEQTPAMDNATPNRNKRKQKPKVVFTMLDSPELESVIRSLGGTVVNSVESCTVLVTANLKRTQKLLAAVGQSKPICSPKWLQDSKKARQFLDPWKYILEDKNAESSWNVSLKQSLLKSRTQKLLHNYLVYVSVTNSVDVLKAAIESCGGKCVTKAPSKLNNDNFIVVANPENKSKYSKFLKRDPPVQIVLPEAIFDGVLRQELRFQDHLLL